MNSVSLVDGHIDEPKMTDDVAKAIDILEKMDFFQGQRAGRELWFDKPADIQDKDIECFVKDIAFLKDIINRQKADNEALKVGYETMKNSAVALARQIESLSNNGGVRNEQINTTSEEA